MVANTQSLYEVCQIFKSAIIQKNFNLARDKLNELNEQILLLDSLSIQTTNSIQATTERTIARDFYEYAVIFSIETEDKESFERYISSLRPIYSMKNSDLPGSEMINIVLGLNLLYLLVENKLAEFHCELELLSDNQHNHPAIVFCTQLDQHLMVGAYDQVLTAAANPPVEYYSFFLKSLLKTVRINIGDCIAASYSKLSLTATTQMLMFDSIKETIAFMAEFYPDWIIKGEVIDVKGTKMVIKSEEIPSLKLINQQLTYANELERIV